MIEKRQYTKRQHYIPQYSLKPFESSKGKCLTINLKDTNLKIREKGIKNIMQEIDLYEFKKYSGEYIERNELEDTFGSLEKEIAPYFNQFVQISGKEDFSKRFKQLISSNEWLTIEAKLLLHIILLLIRNPKVKHLFYRNNNFTLYQSHVFFTQILYGSMKAAELAKQLLNGEDLEIVLQLIRSEEPGIGTLSKRIIINYQIEVYKARGKEQFYLSDNPILVQQFQDIDYLIPISPKVCLGLKSRTTDGNQKHVSDQIYPLSDYDVKRINEKIIKNTDKLFIVSTKKDLEFLKQTLHKLQ